MPNWCSNTLTITGEQKMLDEVRKFLEVKEGRYASPFCFDRIIPYPEPFRTMDAEYAEGKLERDGFNMGGYDWRVANWGTKWDVGDDVDIDSGNGCLSYSFNTAWSPPTPVIERLAAMFPGLDLALHFEEQGACFAGDRKYSDGVLTDEADYEPDEDDYDDQEEYLEDEGADNDAQEVSPLAPGP